MTARAAVAVIAAGLALAAGVPLAQAEEERIGKTFQPLVKGSQVPAQEQQDNALIAISTGCSGALLDSQWVISAAHCFEDRDGNQNVTAADVTVSAAWTRLQKRQAVELYLLAKDIAILRVERPFDEVSGNFIMKIFTGKVAKGRAIKVYGRGIHRLAFGSGDDAVESEGDGQFRSAEFTVGRTTDDHFWFPPSDGAIPAGGDSGGPAFVTIDGRLILAGISSTCKTETLEGKVKEKDDPWKWISKIKECGYAPVSAVWPDIERRIGTAKCRTYAARAISVLQYAQSVNCKPETLSGMRWHSSYDAHLKFCKNVATDEQLAFEESERQRISQECRVKDNMPSGTVNLQVAQNSDAFLLSGSGYEVNARVIIRSTDAAGVQNSITSNRSDAGGGFVASVSAADVCTVAGSITFTAEDQDKAPSAPVKANCPPPAPAGVGDGGSPIAADAQAFNGTWSMRMSNGVGYQLTLEVNGNKVNGTFRSPGRRQHDGTIAGSLNHRKKNGRFEYTFSQPGTGLSSFGVMTVHEDGTIKGTLDEASDGNSYTWTGQRGATVEEDAEAGDQAGANESPPPQDDAVAAGEAEQPQAAFGFAGTWEMRNQSGTRFVLTLKVQGDRVTGKFLTPGRPKNSGRLSGQITGDGEMDYTFEQPRLRFRGQGRMRVSGDEIEGQFNVEGRGDDFSWSGVRTAGGEQ